MALERLRIGTHLWVITAAITTVFFTDDGDKDLDLISDSGWYDCRLKF